jgi:hypothetical protein
MRSLWTGWMGQWVPLAALVSGTLLLLGSDLSSAADGEADPPEVAIGERLFLETRFAQFFFARAKGDANAVLPAGDPVLEVIETLDAPLPRPFGQDCAISATPLPISIPAVKTPSRLWRVST